MADVRPSAISRIETFFRGWVHSDDATLGSGRFDLGRLNGALMTRPVKDALYSDGATTNRRAQITPGTAGALAALPASFIFEFEWPTAIQATDACIFVTGTTPSVTPVNCIRLAMGGGSGTLYLDEFGATGSDFRRLAWAGANTALVGQKIRGAVVFASPNSTTSPAIYINGVDVTANFSGSTGGSPPNWMHTSLDTAYFWSGFSMPAGRFVPHAPILGAMTAAEVLEWTQTGRLPSWCEIGTGSAVDKKSTGGTYSLWFTTTGTVSGGTANAFTVSASTTGMAVRKGSGLDAIIGAFLGVRVRLNITVDAGITGQVNVGDYAVRDFVALSSGTNNYEVTITKGVSVYFEGLASVAGGTITINSIQILGPIIKPVIQPGRHLIDSGSNKITGILTAGITAITEMDNGKAAQSALTANGELLDTGGLLPTDATLLDVIVKNTSANIVYGFALGSTSGSDELTYRRDIAAGETAILAIKRADLAFLTVGTAPFGRAYYSATSWNSGSLNISIRYRRERDL